MENSERYIIQVPASAPTGGTHRVLKDDETFAVFDTFGNIPSRSSAGCGLYHQGTRYLSRFRLTIGAEDLLLLSSSVRENNVLLVVDLTNGDQWKNGHLHIPHGALHVMRMKFLWQSKSYEQITVTNFGETAVSVDFGVEYEADFVDVFEVRGTLRERRGEIREPVIDGESVALGYLGLDERPRVTRFDFTPTPTVVGPNRAVFHVELEPKEAKVLCVCVECIDGASVSYARVPFDEAHGTVLAKYHRRVSRIESSNPRFNAWCDRATSDLRMMVTLTPHGPYPYAGVPWFSTPFGRDGIITALQSLWVDPDLAGGVLRFLAAHQADRSDVESDAEPGKILHEMRSGEMAALREIPFGRYYGSVDSTPLFLLLFAEYWRATADRKTVEELWPNVERALEWIDRHGDIDGDGFVEYGRRSADGLEQQGWKDSHDSVFHADGTPAVGPIALAEVQGYVFAAKRGIARVAAALGQPDRADLLLREAERLRQRFDQVFWCDELSMYALAIDGAKQPCRVRSSNAGHCLTTGIALPHRAERLADELLSDPMFSGWGIRTLAATERRFNPLSYHNGSIWPHDNALIVCGLARYGFKEHALRVFEAMFEASQEVDLHRLPELFCGLPRRPGEGPTLYPVACSPQAWAAATVFYMLQAVLGLEIDATANRVCFVRPVLPRFLSNVRITGLRVGDARIAIDLHRYPDNVGINITERAGSMEIITYK